MSEMPDPPAESSPGPPVVARRQRLRWQVGIRTVVLLTAAIAAWMTVLLNRRHSAELESRIRVMRSIVRDLLVDDASKIAVVKLDETWMDENLWDLHLPPGRYRVCLATRSIDQQGFPPVAAGAPLAPVVASAPLAPGRHRLSLEMRSDQSAHHITIHGDGKPLLNVDEVKAWNPSIGSEGTSGFSTSQQVAADRPVVLFRYRFRQPGPVPGGSVPPGPTDGLLLWVEPLPAQPANR